jgi:hypothetical protein
MDAVMAIAMFATLLVVAGFVARGYQDDDDDHWGGAV